MKNKRILSLFLLISVAIVTFSIYNSTSADGVTTQPGSVDDPMVTKSYVDEQVKLQVAAQIAKLNNVPDAPVSGSGTGAALTTVQLAQGQTLLAGAGTELIVRTGYVTAVSSDGNGIPDVTGGKDIAAKSTVELNHLLIFPTDKRGIKADSKKTDKIFVMVRGNYKLINETGADGTEKVSPTATPTATPTANSNAPVISP